MNTKAIAGPTGQGDSQPGTLPTSGGDLANVLPPTTTGAASAGIGNFPQPGQSNADAAPKGQGDSALWSGPDFPAPPSGDAVEQYADPGDANSDGGPFPTGTPEQAYEKPTGPWTGSNLGPGMRS